MKSPPCALLLFVGFGIPLALFVSIAVRVDIAFDVVVVRGVVVDVDVVVFLVADVVFLESCWRPRPLACCTLSFCYLVVSKKNTFGKNVSLLT